MTLTLPSDPVDAAKEAGLRYVNDTIPGIRREKAGQHFRYVLPNGKDVSDEKELARIKAIGIPPAYTDVWISPYPNGHIQATGRDARGRKQYRYHKRWRETRDETKFDRMLAFAKALPKIRARVSDDLRLPGLPREKVLATVVRLLELTLIRVGNEEYAKNNKHYGLTTLRDRHVKVDGTHVRFSFVGKAGVKHAVDVKDRRLATIIRKLEDLPGQELFEYVDDDGTVRSATSHDVNDYLREISDEPFTAKDFRTWAGTVYAAIALASAEASTTKAEAKKNVVDAIKKVSQRLGNTPAVAKKAYIHPAIIEEYLGDPPSTPEITASLDAISDELRKSDDLHADEQAVLTFLENVLTRDEGRHLQSLLERSVQRARDERRERKASAKTTRAGARA